MEQECKLTFVPFWSWLKVLLEGGEGPGPIHAPFARDHPRKGFSDPGSRVGSGSGRTNPNTASLPVSTLLSQILAPVLSVNTNQILAPALSADTILSHNPNLVMFATWC